MYPLHADVSYQLCTSHVGMDEFVCVTHLHADIDSRLSSLFCCCGCRELQKTSKDSRQASKKLKKKNKELTQANKRLSERLQKLELAFHGIGAASNRN